MKVCGKCKESKPFEAFSKNANGALGLSSYCKLCMAEYQKARARSSSAGTHKVCTKCKGNKPITEFFPDKSRKDGYNNHCKECRRAWGRNSNKQRASQATTLRTGMKHCPGCKEEKDRVTGFYQSKSKPDGYTDYCKECTKARSTAHRQNNPEMYKEYRQETKPWQSENQKALIQKRKAIIRGNGTSIADKVLFSDVVARDKWVCKICGKPVDKSLAYPDPFSPSLDHVVPVSKGGSHTLGNLQLTHLRCNLKKYNHSNSQSVSIL
jgi:hypothetical protein